MYLPYSVFVPLILAYLLVFVGILFVYTDELFDKRCREFEGRANAGTGEEKKSVEDGCEP